MLELSTYQRVYRRNYLSNEKARLSISIPTGTYTIRFLWTGPSSYANFTETQRTNMYYGVFQGATQLGVSQGVGTGVGWTPVNNTSWHNQITFTVPEGSIPVDIAMWNTDSHNFPALNMINLTKNS